MKAIEQYFPVVLFTMLSVQGGCFLTLWLRSLSVTIQVNSMEHSFHVALFVFQ